MTTNHTLHTAKIKNNCPECFANDGLEFIFTQDKTSKQLYTKASRTIEEKLFCTSCNNTIYPVNWDDDIDRVYQYNKKQVVANKGGIQLTRIGYLVIIVTMIIVVIGVYFLTQSL